MAEKMYGSQEEENLELDVIRAALPRLIEKIDPEEISVHLFSNKIITRDLYDSSYMRSERRIERTRDLIMAVLDAVETNKHVFRIFCSILEDSKKPSVNELGKQLQGHLEKLLIRKQEPIEVENPQESSISLASLKQEIEFLRKSLLQSDENVDVKYTLMKEFISRFIQQSIKSEESCENIRKSLEEICLVDMLVPLKLHDWCFAEFEKRSSEFSAISITDIQCADPNLDKILPLFSKENVYHAILLSSVVFLHDTQNYQSFFKKNPHTFDEVSMSDGSQKENKLIERYLIARKGKTLFVAFCGEAELSSWQDKYKSLDEGISIQKERIPIRFFVEYLRHEDGHQIIFTGFSFGAALAIAVHAELWNQSCLGIQDLKANVACFGFAAPIFNLQNVKQIADDCPDIIQNTHLFYVEDDVFPRVLQCVDFPKPKENIITDSTKKLYSGTISGDIINWLSKLQDIHNQRYKKIEEKSQKYTESLKMSLKAAIPTAQIKTAIYGLAYYIYHSVHSVQSSYDIAELANKDHLQYLNAVSIDSLKADIFKKHSVQRYHSLLQGSFFNSTSLGDKYVLPKQSLYVPQQFENVKPEVKKARFFRHADEVAVVLEGVNLWFCHHIKVGTRGDARIIEIDAQGQDMTMRSISFNYIPKQDDDLLITESIRLKKVSITLFSHFCKSLQNIVEVEKMDDYEISFRQRQLAKLTPTEIIRLSLLSAMLERPSPKFKRTNRPSKRFNTICQFLEDACRIVPVESICHAIENESEDNAWKCAEALIDSKFKPKPSLFFMTSLENAHLRLTTGIPPAVLQRAQFEAIKRVCRDISSPIRTNIQVSKDEVVVTAEEGRMQPIFSKSKRGKLQYSEEAVFDEHEKRPLFSEILKEQKSHSILIPRAASKQTSKHLKIITELQRMSVSVIQQFNSTKGYKNSICGLNIEELYPVKDKGVPNGLKPPIEFLKAAKKKLVNLQAKAQEETTSLLSDDEEKDAVTEHHNEEMINILNEVMSQEVAICLSLLGAFMERQMKVPFVNSPLETAQILQTTQTSSAVGVWTLFSLNMINMQSLLDSSHGKLIIEVERYINGILSRREFDRDHSPDRGRYAGKLQFLMTGMTETISCNTQYISYSLERQLNDLCKEFDINSNTRVNDLVREWNKTFSKSILFHVMIGFRPLLARWLVWSLNIHKLREELSSHTTVGIVGLSKSGKSCLVQELFHQEAISGTSRTQRTTVPFLYNLEGVVDGLSIADFPGVDDKDKTVVKISNILLQLSQIVVLVVDYRRISTESATKWLARLDQSGVPVLLCLTHADKFYANQCLRVYGDNCTDNIASRVIGKEMEDIKNALSICPNRKTIFCSFCQDADSILNCEEGRKRLLKLGIFSQTHVGEWLSEKLKHQGQNEIAEKLLFYLSHSEKIDESVSSLAKPEVKNKETATPLVMPKLLRSVTHEYGQTAYEITRKSHQYQYINWDGYGIRLAIPPGALEEGITYTIALKAVAIKEFKLPYEADIVSGFYWLFSSYKFLQPVDLIIKHCARLEEKGSTSRMSIVAARCDQDLPYKFHDKDGVFELQSREGLISTKTFSFYAIVRKCLMFISEIYNPAAFIDTYYVFKVFGKKSGSRNTWHFDFFFLKDIEPYIKAVDQKCYNDGWTEDTPATSFDFDVNSDAIDVTLTPPSSDSNGWSIKRKCTKKIQKLHIDRSMENTTQQGCRIEFQWRGDGSPQHIDCLVTLNGAHESLQVNLTVPFADEEDNIPVTPRHHLPVLPPVTRESSPTIIIHNHPVIDVNTNNTNR